jgi:hypothetical protein
VVNQTHAITATLLGAVGRTQSADDRRMLEAIQNPRPGDWVLVSCALQPVENRIGRLIRVTAEAEYTRRWLIADAEGTLWDWHNCKVLRLIGAGNPYAGMWKDEPDPKGAAWAAEQLARVKE